MSDPAAPSPSPGDEPPEGRGIVQAGTVDPQRLLRIAGVTREVLDEARRIRPEAGAVEHLKQVHARITQELREALPPELWEELDELTPDVRDGTLEELSLAHSEILGWLEGLFQGTQLALLWRRGPSASKAGGAGSSDRRGTSKRAPTPVTSDRGWIGPAAYSTFDRNCRVRSC